MRFIEVNGEKVHYQITEGLCWIDGVGRKCWATNDGCLWLVYKGRYIEVD